MTFIVTSPPIRHLNRWAPIPRCPESYCPDSGRPLQYGTDAFGNAVWHCECCDYQTPRGAWLRDSYAQPVYCRACPNPKPLDQQDDLLACSECDHTEVILTSHPQDRR